MVAGVGRLVSSDAIPVGGLTPGAMLAGRYRIIGLLGRGGMGEVYRADDVKLGQPVALKFLPKALSDDPVRRERFFAEVRITRQLAHPNICRVYDIEEADGQHFLSMEYIDGEDLASLLKRIGYLADEKALDITRQLLAGLAAAHERGVLHRDLKPSNIMLDGRGRVRITDFGLAVAITDETPAGDVSGTPAYMAPEQLAGKGATVRSDIYAIGLILYEVLSGKKAFTAPTLAELRAVKEQSTPTAPSELRANIDPAVERLVMRCLERDPRARPASVAQLVAALPGGDPLAAAIAAGETPSPELLVASGSKEGLHPFAAVGLLAAFVALVLVSTAMNASTKWIMRIAPGKSPEVLVDRARQIVRKAGYTNEPVDSAFGFGYDLDLIRYVQDTDKSPRRWDVVDTIDPVVFWYRQSPRQLERTDFGFGVGSRRVTPDDPPFEFSGEVLLSMDSQGRLRTFDVVPPQVKSPQATSPSPDWAMVKNETPFDQTAWTPVEPGWNPAHYADVLVAWNVRLTQKPDIPVRVEAASYAGRVVSMQMVAPWTRPRQSVPAVMSAGEKAMNAAGASLLMALLLGGFFFARRNLRLGRGDRRGTMRLVVFASGASFLSWVLAEHHVTTFWELGMFLQWLAGALFAAGLVAVLYLAIEPYVRRRSPQLLVSWTRMLSGEWSDPLVGRDVLVGCAAGLVYSCLWRLESLAPGLLGYPAGRMSTEFIDAFTRPLFFAARLVDDAVVAGIMFALGMIFILFLLRVLCRYEWVVAAIWIFAMSPQIFVTHWTAWPAAVAEGLVLLLVVRQFGLGAAAVAGFVIQASIDFPVTFQPSAWYAGYGYAALAVIAAIAFYGFKTSLGGQRLLEIAAD
jgi:serine/threonine-protein kinase